MILSRYMSFRRFIDLLINGLYVPNSSKFDDRWEGLPALVWNCIAAREEIFEWNKMVKKQIALGNSTIQKNDLEEIPKLPSLENIQKAKTWIYVSCWHMFEDESMAMWKIYASDKDGVCIVIDSNRLKEVFEAFYKESGKVIVLGNKVAYLNPGEKIEKANPADFDFFPKNEKYKLNPAHFWTMGGLRIKHKAFKFENEFRIICDTLFLSKEDKLKNNKVDEIYVKFPKDVVLEVILSPSSSDKIKDAVEDLLRKYGYNCKVRKSIIDCNVF